MNFQAHTIRLIISIGLCVLGFLVPFIYMAIHKLLNPESYNLWGVANAYSFQWTPLTSLLWLTAGYILPFQHGRIAGWIIFALGILHSVVAYSLYRLFRQY